MELATSVVGQAHGFFSDMSEQDRLDYGALVQKLSLQFGASRPCRDVPESIKTIFLRM